MPKANKTDKSIQVDKPLRGADLKARALELRDKGLTHQEIADLTGITRPYISKLISNTKAAKSVLDTYDRVEGDVLTGLKADIADRLTTAIQDVQINTAKDFQNLAVSYAVLFDKAQLKAALPTALIGIAHMSQDMQELERIKDDISRLKAQAIDNTTVIIK